MLYGREIDKFAKRDSVLHICYGGTTSRDSLAKLHENYIHGDNMYPICYVCNTDTSFQPGSHWIGIYLSKPGVVEFFDSYGLEVCELWPEFAKFNNKYGWLKTINNNIGIQDYFSTTCGYYCLNYLYNRTRGLQMSRILNQFTDNRKLNDELIRSWYFQIK